MSEEEIETPILSPAIFNLKPVASVTPKRKAEGDNYGSDVLRDIPIKKIRIKKENSDVNEEAQLEEVCYDVIQLENGDEGDLEINSVLLHCDNPKYENLANKIYNFLNLEKTFRWLCAEFFDSNIDESFYNANTYEQCIRSEYPLLKTRMLRRAEWARIRSKLGRPRRLSPSFYIAERTELEYQRNRIFRTKKYTLENVEAHNSGKYAQLLPPGTRIMARLRHPINVIYHGVVESIYKRNYFIKFDKEGLGIQSVADYDIMTEQFHNGMMNSDFLNSSNDPNKMEELNALVYNDIENGNVDEHDFNMLKRMIELKKQLSFKAVAIARLRMMNDQIERSSFLSEDFQRNYVAVILSLENLYPPIAENFIQIENQIKKMSAVESESSIANALEKCRQIAQETSSGNTEEILEEDGSMGLINNISKYLHYSINSGKSDPTILADLQGAVFGTLGREDQETKPPHAVDSGILIVEPNQNEDIVSI